MNGSRQRGAGGVAGCILGRGDLGHPGGCTHLQGFPGASAGHPKAEAGLTGTALLDNFSFTCMDMDQAFPETE